MKIKHKKKKVDFMFYGGIVAIILTTIYTIIITTIISRTAAKVKYLYKKEKTRQ